MKVVLMSLLAFGFVSVASALEKGKYLVSCVDVGGKEHRAHRGFILTVDENGVPSAQMATEEIAYKGAGEKFETKVIKTSMIPGQAVGLFILTVQYENIVSPTAAYKEKHPEAKAVKEAVVLTMVFNYNEGKGSEIKMGVSNGGKGAATYLEAQMGQLPE